MNTKSQREFRCQNGRLIEQNLDRRYAFGHGTQLRLVELFYDHDTDELMFRYGRSSPWCRASEAPDGWHFREVDTYGTECAILVGSHDEGRIRERISFVVGKSAQLRDALAGLRDHLVGLGRDLSDSDRRVIHDFVLKGTVAESVVRSILVRSVSGSGCGGASEPKSGSGPTGWDGNGGAA